MNENNEVRLIDANKIKPVHVEYYGKVVDWATIEYAPTIDPENIPIVRQLRNELARVTAERDAAIEDLRGDCGKCSHFNVIYNGCTPDFDCPLLNKCLNIDMWEWRGQQKEE